jgi:hypothetical protein
VATPICPAARLRVGRTPLLRQRQARVLLESDPLG